MKRRPSSERGTAAFEMVLVLIFTTALLAAVVLFGRLTWHWIALEKSVASTTRIIAALPRETLVGPNSGTDIPARALSLITAGTNAAGIDIRPTPQSIAVMCGIFACTQGVAATNVSVSSTIAFSDTVFGNATYAFLPESGVLSLGSAYNQLCLPAATANP